MQPDIVFILGTWGVVLMLHLYFRALASTHPLASIRPIVGSWLAMLTVLFVCYLLGTWAMILLCLAIWCKAVHEIFRLWRFSKKFIHKKTAVFIQDWILLVWVSAFCLCLPWLYHTLSIQAHKGVLLFVLFCVQSNDVAQYIAGKLLGGRFFLVKLAPTISPNKTIEGALFGTLLMALIATPLGVYLTSFEGKLCFVLALCLGILGIAGDLLESAVKRRHHIKDMGFWLKGHGGILDRIDSLLFAMPLFFLAYMVWLRHI